MSSGNSAMDDTSDFFFRQYNELKKDVEQAIENSKKISVSQIVEIYYQVINVTSLLKSIMESNNHAGNSDMINQIKESDQFIENKFNKELHPLVILRLKESIDNFRKQLKDNVKDKNTRTKKEIEDQAEMYEELRQVMSTKEFVEQYDRLLNKNN